MNSFKRKTALILSFGLILTSIPFSGSHVSAEILPEPTETVEEWKDTENAAGPDLADKADIAGEEDDKAPDYIEGDVIVCMKTGGSAASYGNEEITNDMAGAVAGLLDEAEDLMDVTEAVKESEELASADETAGNADDPDNKVENDKTAFDEEYILKFIHSDEYSTDRMIEMLEADPDILFAEPDYIYHLTDELEEDTLLEDEEADKFQTETLDDVTDKVSAEIFGAEDKEGPDEAVDLTGLQYAYGNEAGGVDVPYWNTEGYKNAENTVVAVLDSGVDYNHEDLKEVMWDDGLLYPELTALGGGRYGYNSMKTNSTGEAYFSFDPMDDNSHGTHCAGSVGAPWNGYGVSGTANGTEIMAVKASNENASFPHSATLRGFNYIKTAREVGVNVVAVNCSWGGGIDSNSIRLAVKELTELNVVCCFAAGNDNTDNDYIQQTPSIMRENDGVICVNSNDSAGQKSDFSNYGIRTTDLSSPGSGILSTVPTGTGPLDPDLCTPVKDASGKDVKDDFQGDEIYFSYEDMNGASHDITEDGGRKALKISQMPDEDYFLSIKPGALSEKPEYFAISSRYEENNGMVLFVDVLCNDGTYYRMNPQYYMDTEYRALNEFKVPDDMNLETPEFILRSRLIEGKSGGSYYIKGISLVSSHSHYERMDGTSMATPAVTGEVAVLASRWPGDSAAKRAARVTGSTKDASELADTSRTGGIANVRNALECDYAPVVNRAWVDEEGELNVSGYFFGNEMGSIEILSGNTALTGYTIAGWKGLREDEWDDDGNNDEDVIEVNAGPGGWPDSEIKIIVTSSGQKSGSRVLEIHGAGDFAAKKSCYDRLAVPVPADGDLYRSFSRTMFCNGAALDGVIYYTGIEFKEEDTYYVLWKYTLPGDGVLPSWEKSVIEPNVATESNICAWNGMLIYRDEKDRYIKLYSPGEGMIYDTGISIPDAEGKKYPNVTFVNAGGELYLLVSEQEEKTVNGNKQYVDKETQLYRIDIQKKAMNLLGTLASIQKAPVITAGKDETGKVIITSMTKKDETSIEKEVITVNGDEMTSVNETISLASGLNFDGQALTGAACQYGIVLAGPVDKADNGDNFLYSPDDNSITKCSKQIVTERPAWAVVTEYKGRTYFLCPDIYSDDGLTFAVADDDEFRGSGEVKEPLHYYGDDESGDDLKLSGSVELKAANEGHVAIGKSIGITPAITENGGKKINYIWYSEDAFIASVDQTGKVIGKSTGNTYIHVIGRDTAGNKYEGKCSVNVYPAITEIKLNTKKLSVAPWSEFTIEASLAPVDALTDRVEWIVDIPESYPGLVERIGEGHNSTGCYVSFRVGDPGKKLQFKITAKDTDGSKKKATCLVTIDPSKTTVEASNPVKSAALSDIGTIYLGAGMEHEISLVRVKPENSSGYTVEWKSSDPEAVAVSGNNTEAGKAIIKAGNSGNAKIRAVITNTAPGSKTAVTVKGLTVKVVQSDVSGNSIRIFNKKEDITDIVSGNRLAAGKNLTLKASVLSDGKPVKENKARVIWTSSDPSVATAVNGKIKAYKEGEVTFKATLIPVAVPGGAAVTPVSAFCTFYIFNPIKKLSLNSKSLKLVSGSEFNLIPVYEVALAGELDNEREVKEFSFTSSDPSVADVTLSTGTYTGITPKKAGKAVITCKALDGSGKQAKCTVTVYDKATGVKITAVKLGTAMANTFNEEEITVRGLGLNKTFTIQPNVEPVTAFNKTVVYASGNPAVLKVSNKGVVKRVGPGSADIYVTTVDGGYTAVCHVVE